MPSTLLSSSEHGFDDYDVSGIECVYRITVGRGIKRGDLCNVYCADSHAQSLAFIP